MSGKFKCLLGKKDVVSLWMEDGELYCICVNKKYTKEESIQIALKEFESFDTKDFIDYSLNFEVTNKPSCLFRSLETEMYYFDSNSLSDGYMVTEPLWIYFKNKYE